MTRFRLRSDGLSWREIEGEVVALDATGSTYLGANRAGALLWGELAEGATADELVELVSSTFGVEPEAARTDVEAFLSQLSERGLLEDE